MVTEQNGYMVYVIEDLPPMPRSTGRMLYVRDGVIVGASYHGRGYYGQGFGRGVGERPDMTLWGLCDEEEFAQGLALPCATAEIAAFVQEYCTKPVV